MIKTSDFDYDIPEELIAQSPLKDRTSSRLMVINKNNKTYEDKHFNDILDYLEELGISQTLKMMALFQMKYVI